MPTYKYVARDPSGKATAGKVAAEDETELRRILRMNDLYLTQIKGGGGAVAGAKDSEQPSIFSPKVTLEDMVIAMRQLGSMIRAGMPLLEALEVIGEQTNKPPLRLAFRDIAQGVTEGQLLSAGMRKYPKIFNTLVVSLVEAGEVAGTLEFTLEVAAEQLDREDNLRRRVKAAMLYPKLVVLACIGTIAGMLLLVVPVFAQVYGELKAELPAATTTLIAISDFAVGSWWKALIAIIVLVIGYKKYAEWAPGRRRLDIISLKLPILGIVLRKIAIARFVQTLAGALKGGVPVLRSIAISANTAGNSVIRDSATQIAQAVREGAPMAPEFEKSGQFPIMVSRMIAAGESTGNIDSMLEEINRFYERDIEYAVDKLCRMIEPLMTVLVGGIVLLVLLALYMPIFNLGKAFTDSAKK